MASERKARRQEYEDQRVKIHKLYKEQIESLKNENRELKLKLSEAEHNLDLNKQQIDQLNEVIEGLKRLVSLAPEEQHEFLEKVKSADRLTGLFDAMGNMIYRNAFK